MKKVLCISVFPFLLYADLLSQEQANIWYFGHRGGLNFSSGSPAILSDGQIYTDEGVATISDANGILLFYTEGTTIWNKNHMVMPNGRNLNGTFTSTQSAIIVPKINDPSRYYVFTVDQIGFPKGLQYSLVNMDLDDGFGDVELKNVPLVAPICEKLTAVKHCNGNDIWLIVHGWNSDAFYAYLITAAGINSTPIVSNTGRVVSSVLSNNAIGCMKASPDAKKIALAHQDQGLDLCDFDNSTGVVSNGQSLFLPTENYDDRSGPYGVEFSPDSKLLYVSGDYFDYSITWQYSFLLQYNIALPDLPSIRTSKKIIYHELGNGSAGNFGTLQIGPDSKIYLAEWGRSFLSVINRPDSIGAACQFVYGQQSLSQPPNFYAESTFGLPAFIQSYWRPDFRTSGQCAGNRIYFDYEQEAGVLSVRWDFGDPVSGINNTSTDDSTYHDFLSYGMYTVKFIRYKQCGNDTTVKQVQVGQLQFVLGNDTVVCGANNLLLDPVIPSGSGNSFLWQDGSATPTYTADTSGLFWVEVSNSQNNCFRRDSIYVALKPYPQFTLGNDLIRCDGELETLSISVPSATFLWSDGSIGNTQMITQTGIYWLDVTLDGCTRRDSAEAKFYPYPVVNLGNDTTLCEDQNYVLNAANPGFTYVWQDNSSLQTYPVNTPGTYWVNVIDHGCSTADSIRVKYDLKPVFSLGNDTSICIGMTIELKPTVQSGSALNYLWSNGYAGQQITIAQGGLYSLQVTNDCGVKTDEILVKKGICKIYVPTGFTPNRDGLNDVFKANFRQDVTHFQLQVFNRWGRLVFQTTEIRKGWDGNISGFLSPMKPMPG